MTNAPPPLGRPCTLPCGAILKNRIAKSAMSDSLGDGAGNATPEQARLYERWAEGGAGLSIVGEVQVSPSNPEKPGNIVMPQADPSALQALTARATVGGSHIWAQLGHAGALSHPPISTPLGPSPLAEPELSCAGMRTADIDDVVDAYAAAAERAKSIGFTGVEIHAAHGFLLSQFLSPLFNRRDDAYGGSLENRARLLLRVIASVRAAVGDRFPVGMKINATDQLAGGLSEDESAAVIASAVAASIDLVDVSGGTYFPGAKPASDMHAAGPYFARFAERIAKTTACPVMLTGGFKSYEMAVETMADTDVDVIGLARPLALNPELAKAWANGEPTPVDFPRFASPPPGGITAWYTMRLTALGEDCDGDFDMDLEGAIAAYDARDAARTQTWLARFGAPGLGAART
ncbi:MAG: oxidoreductase [Pseudomonadota bacterium]